jgi:hypothetical protein
MSYRVKKEYEGVYVVIDTDAKYGGRVARVGKFMPGPMIWVRGGSLTSPALAKAVARAMTRLANDIEKAEQ